MYFELTNCFYLFFFKSISPCRPGWPCEHTRCACKDVSLECWDLKNLLPYLAVFTFKKEKKRLIDWLIDRLIDLESVWLCVCTSCVICIVQVLEENKRGHQIPRAGITVTGSCELPNTDSGNWTLVFCKSSWGISLVTF